MTRRRVAVAPACPDLVKDEAIVVPRGETTYTLDFDDATIELLAAGICPADVARRAWECLGWKREHYRNDARELPYTYQDFSTGQLQRNPAGKSRPAAGGSGERGNRGTRTPGVSSTTDQA